MLVVVGLVLTAWATVPHERTKTRTISKVPDVTSQGTYHIQTWILIKFSLWYQGEFSGSLSWSPALDEFGWTFVWELFGQSKFDYGKETGSFGGVFAEDALSDVPLQTTGNYYLLLFYVGPGGGANWIPPQLDREYNVTVHYHMTGWELGVLAPGIGVLLLACPVLFYSRRWRRKEA